eukprot:COSAG02_NODE_45248_length_359_cov_0.584615_2_plen_46_part_01
MQPLGISLYCSRTPDGEVVPIEQDPIIILFECHAPLQRFLQFYARR